MPRLLLAVALLPLLVACTTARQLPATGVFPPEGSESRIVEVPADPEAGFNYEFYLLIPPGFQAGDSTRLLVEPNNTGTVDDRHRIHAEKARRMITGGHPRRLAEELGVPLLVPTLRLTGRWLWLYWGNRWKSGGNVLRSSTPDWAFRSASKPTPGPGIRSPAKSSAT
jgi:hypothetical protein